MSVIGKVLTASVGLTATFPAGRVSLEDKTFMVTTNLLGKGGFGTVREGIDLSTQSPVAVKTQLVGPFAEAEVQALRILRDIPHAVGFRADILGSPKSKPEEQQRHIVMDLVKNKDIVSVFFNLETPHIKLTYAERITISRQALECLEGLHAKGWTYFDLKLSNLIFDRESQSLRVIDFGGARDTSQEAHLRPITTVTHRAPELILGKKLSPSYDIWSFGCMLYILLTDQPLFRVPKEIQEGERGHYVLQQIVARLGKPSFEYLLNSPEAPKIFDINREFRQKVELPPVRKWEEVVREKGQEKGLSPEDIAMWISMISSCLRYENRPTTTELLQSPIFKREIAVHFHFNSHYLMQCNMYLMRAECDDTSGTLPNANSYDLKLNIDHTTNSHLHLPRDATGEYILALEKDGIFSRHQVPLKEGSILDISFFQKALLNPSGSSVKKNLLQRFEEAFLEREAETDDQNLLNAKEPPKRAPGQPVSGSVHLKAAAKKTKRPVEQMPAPVTSKRSRAPRRKR
ncbi:MAG: serine/threonine-protein kinase [Verrucomicrobia bacterium]|nr:serine/threonine-protein kinase [Verrucomicrobiota bacterium]